MKLSSFPTVLSKNLALRHSARLAAAVTKLGKNTELTQRSPKRSSDQLGREPLDKLKSNIDCSKRAVLAAQLK